MAASYGQSRYGLRRVRSGVVGMKRKHSTSEPEDSSGSSEEELEPSKCFSRYVSEGYEVERHIGPGQP